MVRLSLSAVLPRRSFVFEKGPRRSFLFSERRPTVAKEQKEQEPKEQQREEPKEEPKAVKVQEQAVKVQQQQKEDEEEGDGHHDQEGKEESEDEHQEEEQEARPLQRGHSSLTQLRPNSAHKREHSSLPELRPNSADPLPRKSLLKRLTPPRPHERIAPEALEAPLVSPESQRRESLRESLLPSKPREHLEHYVAHAIGNAGKDEDRHVVDTASGFFAVFDGHGGSMAADMCVKDFLKNLEAGVASGKSAGEAALATCWNLDGRLLTEKVADGTTATILHLNPVTKKATLGWVGDSSAIRVNMRSKDGSFKKTQKHTPESQYEICALRALWRCRENLEEARRSIIEKRAEAIKRGEVVPELVEPLVDVDAFAREQQKILLPDSREGILADALARNSMIDIRFSVAGLTRRCSILGRRVHPQTGVVVGPEVIITAYENEQRGVPVTGTSTQMTRSIGDGDAGRCVLPELEFEEWTVKDDSYERIVIASDGLWDYITFEKAAKLVAGHDSAQVAGKRLLQAALLGSRKKGHATWADDTTIIVVDINPSALRCLVPQKSFIQKITDVTSMQLWLVSP